MLPADAAVPRLQPEELAVRRRHLHLAFGIVALASAASAAYDLLKLQQAHRVNQAIARSAAPQAQDASLPEVQFAQALELSAKGDYDGSLEAHKALLQNEPGALKEAALFNLGNLHLREALKHGSDEAARSQSLPLIELAKQSYRDALRGQPEAWDARYNLERALWLAPEADEAAPELDPPSKERAITTAPADRSDLP
jgi:mxaK protein